MIVIIGAFLRVKRFRCALPQLLSPLVHVILNLEWQNKQKVDIVIRAQ